MKTLTLVTLLVAVATAAAAPPPPQVIVVEVESKNFQVGAFLNGLPVHEPEPGGYLVAKTADPEWFAVGLQAGDVIVTENGSPVGELLLLTEGVTLLGIHRRGKPVLLHITMHGDSALTATLDDEDMRRVQAARPPYSVPVRDRHGPSGVRITDILLATFTKLAVGDIVRQVGGKPITTDAELGAAMQNLAIGTTDIAVERLGRPVTLTLTREAPLDLTTIKKTGATSYDIPRRIADAILADPRMLERKVNLVPAGQNGKLHGFKLYDVEPDSMLAALGLQNEDVVLDLDGMSFDTRDEAFKTMRQLRNSSVITLAIVRRGKRLALIYTIR